MKNSVITGFSFLLGMGIGAYVTYMYVKDMYAEIAQEEINSVKEAYAEKAKNLKRDDITEDEKKEKADKAKNKPDISEYAAKLKESGYTNYSEISQEDNDVEVPYVIAPEDYGENDEYETISLTYYSDGVLTDEDDEVITNPGELVGKDFASHFGDYEDDSVFIRNDERKIDFEILMDYRTYQDVLKAKPHLED